MVAKVALDEDLGVENRTWIDFFGAYGRFLEMQWKLFAMSALNQSLMAVTADSSIGSWLKYTASIIGMTNSTRKSKT